MPGPSPWRRCSHNCWRWTPALNANDGSADVFRMSIVHQEGQDQLQVSVNDRVAFSGDLSDVGSVAIRGSGDDDVLVAQGFDRGTPGLPAIQFDGDGGFDQMQLVGGPVDSVTYQLDGAGAGSVLVGSAGGLTDHPLQRDGSHSRRPCRGRTGFRLPRRLGPDRVVGRQPVGRQRFAAGCSRPPPT